MAGLEVVLPPEVDPPDHVAVGVDGEELVGVRGARVEGAGTEGDAHSTSAEEVPDGRRRVDGLVGVMVADQVPAGTQNPDMAAVLVLHVIGVAGRRVPALDDLGSAVAVQVGQRRCGESAVGREERPAGEHGAVAGVECVGVLTERRCLHGLDALHRTDGQ